MTPVRQRKINQLSHLIAKSIMKHAEAVLPPDEFSRDQAMEIMVASGENLVQMLKEVRADFQRGEIQDELGPEAPLTKH